jgi:hypothetical protein
MELIINYFLSETPFVSRIWGEGIWKQYSLTEKIQNFGNDLKCIMPWMHDDNFIFEFFLGCYRLTPLGLVRLLGSNL